MLQLLTLQEWSLPIHTGKSGNKGPKWPKDTQRKRVKPPKVHFFKKINHMEI